MKDSKTPPLSDGSSASSKDSPFESTPTSLLPNYTDATGSAARPSNQVDQIALTLKNASLKLCDGPGLTPDERKEVDKALTKGVKIGLSSAKLDICNLDDLKAHLKLLNLFDRLRQHVQDGTEYFDYPSCQQAQDDGHIDAPGIDAPPPPYAPTAELPPPTNAKSGSKPTQQEAEEAAAELSEQLKRERRWNIFLNRAAYRMEIWFNQILVSDAVNKHFDHVILVKEKAALREFKAKEIDGEDVEELLEGVLDNAHDLPDFALPPLDVALMLHSYHLNPLAKEEDDQRLKSRLPLGFFDYPLHQLAQRAHPDLPILTNIDPAKGHWEQHVTSTRTKQPWNLSLQPPREHPTHAQETNGGDIFGLRVKCPRCHKTQFVPWTGQGKDPSKPGIGELGWERVCTPVEEPNGCIQLISADRLQLDRFLQDFKRWSRSPGRKFEGKQVFFMAGTMLGPAHAQYSSRDYFGEAPLTPIFLHEKPAVAMSHKDHRVAKGASLQDIEQVGVKCNYSMKTFRAWFEDRWMSNAITPKLKSDEEKSRQMARIAMMMRSYQNGNAAAYGEGLCDVVDGVKRQTSFNLEMEKLGWSTHLALLDQGALDNVLLRSLIRYHKFLELMASVATLLTPTLDIDLCWHTHQLKSRYYSHCFKLVGRFVNHDDAIETGTLKVAFDRTASLWKDRHGQPYSMCGCIYNDPGALKKLKGLLGSGSNSSGKEASESAPTKSGFASRLKGKWRAAKDLPGDKPQDDATTTTVWQDVTHPSAHSAVIVKEEEHRHDKLRELMVKEWAQGKRREGHESAFVFGYDTPVYPFYYSPLYSTHYVSRGSTGDATHNAYSLYGVYGMMAVSGLGMGMAAGGGMVTFGGAGCGGGGS
ncbi:uncharacterized protein UHOD_02699 [Ustilago sp. UG-2017b]|nr:uncharacterized protein UHOD_02699 [Ustilago sp. UG-2017b]